MKERYIIGNTDNWQHYHKSIENNCEKWNKMQVSNKCAKCYRRNKKVKAFLNMTQITCLESYLEVVEQTSFQTSIYPLSVARKSKNIVRYCQIHKLNQNRNYLHNWIREKNLVCLSLYFTYYTTLLTEYAQRN